MDIGGLARLSWYTWMLGVLIALGGACDARGPEGQPDAPAPRITDADYRTPVFGGKLLGTDRGEFIGQLVFENSDGNQTELLDKNVLGMVKTKEGVFVFTGLRHMGTNEGAIYHVSQNADTNARATLLTRLPGAPSRVQSHPDGSATFLIYRGYAGDHPHYECYFMEGRDISPCDAPIHNKPGRSTGIPACDAIRDMKSEPFRAGERGVDASYDELFYGDAYALREIAQCTGDERIMVDPRPIPAKVSDFAVGDAAFFLIMDKTGAGFEWFLPADALAERDERGASVYFDWVRKPGNRALLERSVGDFVEARTRASFEKPDTVN
ncbi:hypothetical protein [Pseudoxanthomonas beigongshangi]